MCLNAVVDSWTAEGELLETSGLESPCHTEEEPNIILDTAPERSFGSTQQQKQTSPLALG